MEEGGLRAAAARAVLAPPSGTAAAALAPLDQCDYDCDKSDSTFGWGVFSKAGAAAVAHICHSSRTWQELWARLEQLHHIRDFSEAGDSDVRSILYASFDLKLQREAAQSGTPYVPYPCYWDAPAECRQPMLY